MTGMPSQSRKKFLTFGISSLIIAGLALACAMFRRHQGDDDKIPLAKAPAAVQEAVHREANGAKVKYVEMSGDIPGAYEADIKIDGKPYDVTFDAAGKVLKRELDTDDENDEKDARDEKGGQSEKKTSKTAALAPAPGWMAEFGEPKSDLGPTGRNPYFILEPGYTMTLEGREDGNPAVLVVTVLNETKNVDGVETRIVEERETQNGQLAELSRNYFAVSSKTHALYYFGEDTKEYKNGEVSGTAGSWQAGVHGARYGMMLPGAPKVGDRHYQEIAPNDKAMDRAEVLSLSETVKVPAGEFTNCLKAGESSDVESGRETKFYAPGVGILQDGELLLTQYGMAK